jgi:hypothetical protein
MTNMRLVIVKEWRRPRNDAHTKYSKPKASKGTQKKAVENKEGNGVAN